MNSTDKRKLRQSIQTKVINTILDECNNDEEFFIALLYAQQEITNALVRFDDLFDEEKGEE